MLNSWNSISYRNGKANNGDAGAFRNAEFNWGAFGAFVFAEKVVGIVSVLQPDGRGEGHSRAAAEYGLRPESAQDGGRFEIDHDPVFARSGLVSAPSAFGVEADLLLGETYRSQTTTRLETRLKTSEGILDVPEHIKR